MHHPDLNKNMTNEQLVEDLRIDQEIRQDAFDQFVEQSVEGTVARIVFAGDKYKVRLIGRRKQDGMDLVKLEIIGNRHGMDGKYLEFNLGLPNDSELLKIL